MAFQTVATYPGRGIIWSRVLSGGAIPKNIQWGTLQTLTTITASTTSNVNLFGPTTEARTVGTPSIITTTTFGDTLQITGTIVCAVAAKTICEAGLFDAASPVSPTTTVTNSLLTSTSLLTLGNSLGGSAGLFYYAQLGTETVLVTGAAATSLTVTRGVLGTTAVAWPAQTPITMGGDGGSGVAGDTHTTGQTVTGASIAGTFGGNMFIHADFASIALNVNDSISFTFSDTLT